MNILVTGGAGFIGSNFIRYWVAHHAQDRVVCFDKLTYAGNLENLREVEGNPNYRFVRGDICDAAAVDAALAGVDAVVHFAAESHVDRSILGPQVFIQTNVIGTQVLLDAALRHHVSRFHHISTDEVFGALPLGTEDKFHEGTLYKPTSPYSASKAASDHLVMAYHATFGLPATITNASNNYGPYQFPEKLIPLAITNVLEGKPVPVYGDGRYVRDWIHVDDHCRAIDLALQKGVPGHTYCIGGTSSDVSNLDVVRGILSLLGHGEDKIEFVRDRPGHDRRYAINWAKAQRELGYEPAYRFADYLAATVRWYVDHPEWWQRVKSGEYAQYYERQYGKRS